MRVFTSAPIVKRFDVFTLETADGICIVLKGFINKSRTIENGFSSEVFSHFVFGFPTNWEKLLGKEFTAGTGSATCSDVNKSATVLESVAGLANSGLNTTPSKYKENDKKKSLLNQPYH
ncbi:kinetochore-associated protein KNL-2 homolog [Pistacia vera]|uniref:kinetochore-associated protein KNL-2 homolog n=1 Tax=Pistacia vera TaxID=55513 RepID=UPI001263B3FB|nr:kinetochore-associated protein KNL-2 homolog [Pistacia vera]